MYQIIFKVDKTLLRTSTYCSNIYRTNELDMKIFACQGSDILVFTCRQSERIGIPHEIGTKGLWVISVTNCFQYAKCLGLLF